MYIYAMSMPPSSQSVESCCCRVACRGDARLMRRVPLSLIQSHSKPEETEFMTKHLAHRARSVCPPCSSCLRGGVGVHLRRVSILCSRMLSASTDLPLAAGHGDVDETAGVSEPLLRAALGGLLLLLGLNLFQRVSVCHSLLQSCVRRILCLRCDIVRRA